MKRIRFLIIAMVLLALTGSFMNTKTSAAASAEIEISTDSTEVTVGDKLYVYITITSDTEFGDFEGNLMYDDEILEYQGDVSIVAGDSGFLNISDINKTEGDTNRKYSLEFLVIAAGTCDIEFASEIVYDFESAADMSVSSNIHTLKAVQPQTASSNAYLKLLKISPSLLAPAFDRNTFQYNTTVGYETETLVVEALREDEKSTIRITGNDSLLEGENKIIVTVIAESGTVIEYTINAFRESAPAVEVEEETDITPSDKHGTFEVVEIGDEIFAVYGGKYKFVELGSEVVIPSGYIKTRIIISDVSIPVYAPEDNLDYDYLLVYAENELGQTGFYQYDRVERTLQRYGAEIYDSPGEMSGAEEKEIMQSEEYRSNLSKAAILIALLTVLCAFLAVVSIRLFMKSKGYKED